MRKNNLDEMAEPLPLEIAEWMGLADPPRPTLVDEDAAINSAPRGFSEHLRARLTRRLAS